MKRNYLGVQKQFVMRTKKLVSVRKQRSKIHREHKKNQHGYISTEIVYFWLAIKQKKHFSLFWAETLDFTYSFLRFVFLLFRNLFLFLIFLCFYIFSSLSFSFILSPFLFLFMSYFSWLLIAFETKWAWFFFSRNDFFETCFEFKKKHTVRIWRIFYTVN